MSAVTGTRTLLRASLRQDAHGIAPWVMLISMLSASSILAYRWIFPDPAQRQELATTLALNPALSLVFGPPRDLLTADGFNAWRAGMLGAFFAGLMAILVVVRNSRAQEDSGQAELLASAAMGRQTRLLTAVAVAAVASLALGAVCFLLTWASGGGVRSTLVLSACFTASGLVFAGIAAVTSQLGSDARSASGMAVAVLGVAYGVRGSLDASAAPDWTQWLTPFGWLQRAEPAGANDPRPLLVALAAAVVLLGAGFALQRTRDFGSGVVAQRPGPRADRSASIRKLSWRLHRGLLLGWLVALTALGSVWGDLVTSVGAVLVDNPALGRIFASGAVSPADLAAVFVATVLQLVGIIAAVMGMQVVMRVWTEEVEHRAEPLLAGALRRPSYLASNVAVALLATAVGVVAAATGMGWVASRRDDGVAMGDVVLQGVATVPAVWVLVSLGVAVVGAVPGRRIVGWLGIVATFGLTLLGPTFRLPDWALDISPLRHVPAVASAAPEWSGLAWLGLVASALLVVGFAGYRRRDIG